MNLLTIENPDAKWDQFVSEHSHLIFHTSIWGNVLKNGYNTKLLYYVLEDDNQWLLGIPGMLSGRFLKLWYSLVPYGGFIGKREFIPHLVELIAKDTRKRKIDRLQIVDPKISRSGEIAGFVEQESYWHILNLKNKTEEDIYKGYKPNLKRTLNEAMTNEINIEKIKNIKEVETFYGLYLASIRRNRGIVRYPLALFESIFSLIEQGQADIFFANYQGKAVAGIVVIYSEKTAHYFHGGSSDEYLELRPNDLLFHFAITEASKNGKTEFDFLGSSKKMQGLVQFKEKWGTQRKTLYASHKNISKFKPLLHKLLVPFLKFHRAGG